MPPETMLATALQPLIVLQTGHIYIRMNDIYEFMFVIIAIICPAITYYLVHNKQVSTLSANARYLLPLGILPYPLALTSAFNLFWEEPIRGQNVNYWFIDFIIYGNLPTLIMFLYAGLFLIIKPRHDLSKLTMILFALMLITGFGYQLMLGLSRI